MTLSSRARRGLGSLSHSIFLRGICAGLIVFVAGAAWAQAPVGTISGTVRDQSDAVVPAGVHHHPPRGHRAPSAT